MPSIKLLIDDVLVYESTANTNIPNVSGPAITMDKLQEIGNPVLKDRYYYISPHDKKIYRGTLLGISRLGYTMLAENGDSLLLDKIYKTTILKKGGKRKSRRTRKNKKRSTRRR